MSARFMAAASLAFITVGVTVACAPATEAAQVESATPAPQAAAAPDPKLRAAGLELFTNWGCSACHTLADADSYGDVGPSLDGDPRLTEAFIKDRVTNGMGAMPAFGGQMTEEEIGQLSAYIATYGKK